MRERLEGELGQPVEVTVRPTWPTEALPGLVEKWLDQYQPDIVFMSVPSFWFLYESVPLKLQRWGGPAGRWLARLGLASANTKPLAHRRVYHWFRWAAMRTIGGAPHFEPEEVMVVEPVLRSVARAESIGLAVRGPQSSAPWSTTSHRRAWRDARQQRLEGRLWPLCEELHASLVEPGGGQTRTGDYRSGDRNHRTGVAFQAMVEADVRACVAAWERAHPGAAPKMRSEV